MVLKFDLNAFGRNRDTLESLHRGDLIAFNATLSQMVQKRRSQNGGGAVHEIDEETVMHLHALDLQLIRRDDGFRVTEHVHSDGRYDPEVIHSHH